MPGESTVYDFLAVGIGPFNLGLACLTQPIKQLKGVFLDKRPGFNWHPGLLFENARLQTPFMSDLVTLADPTSRFSFLNYSKQQGLLYSFYIRENFFLLRNEYNQYCQWAASQLSNLHFNTEVEAVDYDTAKGCYRVQARCVNTQQTQHYYARRLALGTGPQPYVPACCEAHLTQQSAQPLVHASDYLHRRDAIKQQPSITVVGSGQSAAEIILDLLQDIDHHSYSLNWITRAPRFFPLEYTKLTLEMTSPEYVDYFYQLPASTRDQLNRDHAHLAKGINGDTINEIFDLLYAKRLVGKDLVDNQRVNFFTNSELQQVKQEKISGHYNLHFYQKEQNKPFQQQSAAVILSTGYQYRVPQWLEGIRDRIRWDAQGRYAVGRYYTIDKHDKDIFVQNAEQHTHGFVTPDLGMACYRNAHIIRQLLGREYYPIEKNIAFQTFAAPTAPTEKKQAGVFQDAAVSA
ncbi:MAG: lysine N(6)-hydroxylase/L-ornithine N(5)-oxygenase family protein [Cellvibrionaceae bacterium]|nr:lysine N(6)-hydroxylase/L-ornithine N(5)-oxygenase family protein [Cellvibrionaceae bacterium]